MESGFQLFIFFLVAGFFLDDDISSDMVDIFSNFLDFILVEVIYLLILFHLALLLLVHAIVMFVLSAD